MVQAAVTIGQLERLSAQGQTKDLMAQADAEQG